jgi:hypothetical protein
MYWVIRWTNKQTGEDQSIVVEAKSKVVAETMALKRDIPIVFIGEAEESDVRAAREAKLLWQYTKEQRYTCFGQPVARRQLACLMLCGVWTIGVLLQTSGLIPPLFRVHF